eukprot:25249_1
MAQVEKNDANGHEAPPNEPEAESETQITKADDTQTKQQPKLQLPRKYYVQLDDLLQFLYPKHILHPHSTLRLFLFAEYGPLYNHHSYHQCLCAQCKQKCKEIRKQNENAKQLFLGKILIGTATLDVNDESLAWLCNKCRRHCSTVQHLKSGSKNLHIVSDSELSKMEVDIKRQDLLSCFVSKKEQLFDPLTVEEEEELIQRQPLRVKHVPQLAKQQIINIFSKLPKHKLTTQIQTETDKPPPTELEINETIADDAQQNEDNKDEPQNVQETAPEKEPDLDEQNTENETNEDEENGNTDETEVDKIDEEEVKEEQEEEEGIEALSFYDISNVVRKVRQERKKDLVRRSITTQDPVKKGPKNRSKGLRTRALGYTSTRKKSKVAQCEESSVLATLLHAYTHEITTLNTASETGVTQNVRLLRHLQKDNETNWDA